MKTMKMYRVITLPQAAFLMTLLFALFSAVAMAAMFYFQGSKLVEARMVTIDPNIWKCQMEAQVQTGSTIYDMTPTCIVWSNRP